VITLTTTLDVLSRGLDGVSGLVRLTRSSQSATDGRMPGVSDRFSSDPEREALDLGREG
jgi:hypothetical protein